jgi:DNA polymerase-3 subunit delta
MNQLLKGIEREGNLNFATYDISQGETSFPEIVASALTVPFLGGQRTVVATGVKTVESAFRGRESEEAEDEDISPKGSGVLDIILRAVQQLEHLPEEALLILIEENGHLDGRTSFYKALQKAGCKVETFKAMWFDPASGDLRNVSEFIQKEATRRKIRLDGATAERFALLVGADKGLIVMELDKLAMYSGAGSSPTIEDVENVVTHSYEAGIFHLVDCVGFGRTGEAIEVLSDLMDRGAAPPYILTMLARQIRLIARTREALESGVPNNQDAMAKELKEAKFTAMKLLKQARTFPRFDYPTVLERLMETDVHLKRGTMPAKLALETLITSLAVPGRREDLAY